MQGGPHVSRTSETGQIPPSLDEVRREMAVPACVYTTCATWRARAICVVRNGPSLTTGHREAAGRICEVVTARPPRSAPSARHTSSRTDLDA